MHFSSKVLHTIHIKFSHFPNPNNPNIFTIHTEIAKVRKQQLVGVRFIPRPHSLEITVLQEPALPLRSQIFLLLNCSFGKFMRPNTGIIMMFITGQNTTNCFLIFFGKDEGRKINCILQCSVISPVSLDDWWSIHSPSQADIEDHISLVLLPTPKLLTSWDLAQVPPRHTATNVMQHAARKLHPSPTKMTNSLF